MRYWSARKPVLTLTVGPVDACPAVLQTLGRAVLYDLDLAFPGLYEAVARKAHQVLTTVKTPPGIDAAALLAAVRGRNGVSFSTGRPGGDARQADPYRPHGPDHPAARRRCRRRGARRSAPGHGPLSLHQARHGSGNGHHRPGILRQGGHNHERRAERSGHRRHGCRPRDVRSRSTDGRSCEVSTALRYESEAIGSRIHASSAVGPEHCSPRKPTHHQRTEAGRRSILGRRRIDGRVVAATERTRTEVQTAGASSTASAGRKPCRRRKLGLSNERLQLLCCRHG